VQQVTVIGAGVIGLSTAICLAEAGARVAVHAAEPPGQTTSVAAGALWGPHLVGTDERVPRWADFTLARLHELTSQPFIRVCAGITAVAGDPDLDQAGPPELTGGSPDVAACDPAEVPPGYRFAWRLSAPLVSMPEYLEYLEDRYLQAGGQPITRARYPSLADAVAAAGTPVVVNCPGAGARQLVPDPEVIPYRGQVVVASNPGITDFFVGNGAAVADLVYLFPHGDRVVLGGTEQEGDWNTEPDLDTAERIIAACAAVEPALIGARVLAHRVGLRPFRPEVRLEAEMGSSGTTVVHNYGHGGSGVTLSWGCAREAADLALAALAR
jgi:D-amino-acid oxidase